MDHVTNALIYLISTLFDLYILVLVVRLLLAFARANYFNPLTQFIIKLTDPLVKPLRRLLPNYRGIEFSTLTLIILFEIIKIVVLSFILGSFAFPAIVFIALLATMKIILQAYFYAILLQALLSWFQSGYSPVAQLLEQMTAPILKPLRRIIPAVHGVDITPIPALIIIQLLLILLP